MQVETETEVTTGEPNSTETTTDVKTEDKATETTADNKIDLGLDEDAPADKVEDKASDEPDARYGAPEGDAAYDIKLEGDATLDTEALAMADPLLRELNLSNDSANKLIGTFAEKILPHYQEQFNKSLEAEIVTTRTEWEGAARDLVKGKNEAGEELVAKNKAGEVLGFDGKDLKGVQSIAAKALDRLAPTGFREFLDKTGLGVHPQMIAFAYQAGKAIAEDQDFETGAVQKTALTREQKYYPNS